MKTALRTIVAVFICAEIVAVASAQTALGAQISFHTTAPTPDFDDAYNFTVGSRDGLNVNDTNGLDGPLNDNFTYVANDRPRQGQIFQTPIPSQPQVYRIKSVWLRLAGYTDNGTMPEAGYDGTSADLSAGGTFTYRIGEVGNNVIPGFYLIDTFNVTGSEPNNPAAAGRVTSANGSGVWMKIVNNVGAVDLAPNRRYAFDVASTGAANRHFEWAGALADVYSGGNAYNGNQLGASSSPSETPINTLVGDRAFMVELELIPEPSTFAMAALAGLLLPLARRRRIR